jgi:hypothetical protein
LIKPSDCRDKGVVWVLLTLYCLKPPGLDRTQSYSPGHYVAYAAL